MPKIRKDNKGRNLRPGETQRSDGSYMFVYMLGKKNACTYCPYSTVCGFDTEIPGYEFRRLKNFADEELWNAFAKEVE